MSEFVQASDLSPLFPDANDEVVAWWLDKAERRLASVLTRRGCDLDVLAAKSPAMLATVKDVIENAVMRVLRNPEGLKSETEGDYSYTVDPLDASASVWFPSGDLDLLCPKSSIGGTILIGLPRYRLVR